MVLTQKSLDWYLAQNHQTPKKDLWEEVRKQIMCFDKESDGA